MSPLDLRIITINVTNLIRSIRDFCAGVWILPESWQQEKFDALITELTETLAELPKPMSIKDEVLRVQITKLRNQLKVEQGNLLALQYKTLISNDVYSIVKQHIIQGSELSKQVDTLLEHQTYLLSQVAALLDYANNLQSKLISDLDYMKFSETYTERILICLVEVTFIAMRLRVLLIPTNKK